MIKATGNIDLCEQLDDEPKAKCKVCLSYWTVGIVYCTCGHSLRDGTEKKKKFVKITLDPFSFPITTSRKDDPTGTAAGRSRGITSTSSQIRSRRNARRKKFWVFTTGSSVIKNSEKPWSNRVEVKKYVVRRANWRTKFWSTTSLDEVQVYRNNWWIRSNFVASDTMPVKHRSDFKKKHSLPFATSKIKRIKLITKNGKVLPHLGGIGKIPGGFLPFLMTDGDSVTINTLCNSANGTYVTLDDYLPITGRKKGIKNITLRVNSRRNARRENSWAFTIVSSVMRSSERPWSNWVALKKWFARWTNWRTRITHTMLQKKNSMYTVAIGGSVRILLLPTRCP